MTTVGKVELRERRKLWPVNDGTAHVFDIPDTLAAERMKLRNILMGWINNHTTGEFYLGHNTLCFYDDKDAMAFTIYGAMDKCVEEFKLER